MRFLVERIVLRESKADIQRLVDFVNDYLDDSEQSNKYVNDYIKMKNRMKAPYNDLYYWIKRSPSEFIDYVNNLSQTKTHSQVNKIAKEGADLVGENNYYKVYKINSFDASVKYGKGSKWCITGCNVSNENEPYGRKYWDQYTNEDNATFYFYISKNSKEKYALTMYDDDSPYEIWDARDRQVQYIPNGDGIKGLPDTEKDYKYMLNGIANAGNFSVDEIKEVQSFKPSETTYEALDGRKVIMKDSTVNYFALMEWKMWQQVEREDNPWDNKYLQKLYKKWDGNLYDIVGDLEIYNNWLPEECVVKTLEEFEKDLKSNKLKQAYDDELQTNYLKYEGELD